MLLMGKSTISMTIFNSKLLFITRGYDVAFHKSVHVVPSLGGCNSARAPKLSLQTPSGKRVQTPMENHHL